MATSKADKNRIFADRRKHLEFMRVISRKIASGGERVLCLQSTSLKNSMVCLRRHIIVLMKIFLVRVKTIKIFHDKLTPAQQAGLCPRFVSKFSLNLISRKRQVAVGVYVF